MRLDKYLSESNIGTRSEVKKIIKSGRVSVDGDVVKDPQTQIGEKAAVLLDEKEVEYKPFRYYLLYKPAGCVSAVKDNLYPTVMEYLSEENIKDCSPVGRLDIDTEGLLLITNDGGLSHRLLSPANHVEKVYYAILDKMCPKEAVAEFENGIDIGDDKPTLPAKLFIGEPENEVRIIICEGRFHQVKRMFEKVGCRVTYLRRESMGGLTLSGLQPGQYRELSREEITSLQLNYEKV